ncbi:simple sugar transport system substrate-binding protein/D-xylose transport system substrate-binding protein [Nonomuraea thailandensis]|uniref:Simple sugar transport system substrate-binding protein/D-xylose transport system substrate-binding protein n=1 Tax=Nonomuraea thailandensis TaxID=1188745 RepID=A0A9X2H311_9ACTN|nr:sugar ABC transporter substrate-binding protein [Nonomuraea thailandensis]MCP2365038.1 simple sugar transport system substrate-binding protein/D-xylose transport system substrate-binding protein [Nonomuraea thailandensis]
MNRAQMRTSAFAAVAVLAGSVLAACGSGSDAGGGTGGGDGGVQNAKVAFLMPDLASTRYELQDKPLFEAKMKQLCPTCEVIYQNADSDAAKQQQQANSALAQGVKAIVIDPVDSAAAATIVKSAQAQQVPIIAYDRPIPATPADYYISFDNEKIGSLIAQSLVDHLKAENAEGGILQVNGSPTDAAAGLIKKGIHSAVDPSGFKLLAEYDTPDWQPEKAQTWVSGQITQFKDQIVGVVAANDGTGGGTIAAFKAAGVKVPPVTGNDAEVAAAQRIVAGDQYNTISKPIKIVAEASANVAWEFMQGKKPAGKTTLYDTPSELFVPTVVTKENIKEVLFDSGIMKAADVCSGEYAKGCEELGIK